METGINIQPLSGGKVRVEMTSINGKIILNLEVDDNFPVVDVSFPDGKGRFFTVNANTQDKTKHVPQDKDLCITLDD